MLVNETEVAPPLPPQRPSIPMFAPQPLWKILDHAEHTRWRGLRSEAGMVSGANTVVDILNGLGVETFDDIRTEHLQSLADALAARGNSKGTVGLRFITLRQLHVMAFTHDPQWCNRPLPKFRVSAPKPKKWWLTPDMHKRLHEWLPSSGIVRWEQLQDYVEFVINTGLRVEEALRVRKSDFVNFNDPARMSLHVPGTKNEQSDSTVPLRRDAAHVVSKRLRNAPSDALLFDIDYVSLRLMWAECRKFLGFENSLTCTLKALRRSFAKICSDKKIPTELVQKLLRQKDIKTTIGYLNLVGSIDTDQTRQWLE